jgi:hypothetical protein
MLIAPLSIPNSSRRRPEKIRADCSFANTAEVGFGRRVQKFRPVQ